MKKFLFALAALSLIFACTPENNSNNGGGQNNPDELTVTGEALDVTYYTATLTGYANLPFELGDAEVGIMYDKQQSFESAKKVAATGLDGNNKFTVTATDLKPSTTYYFKSYVQNGMAVKYGSVKSFTTQVVVREPYTAVAGEAVDLGLSVKWSSMNLGATSPTGYGDYFAWGETAPKDDYSWATYELCNGSKTSLTKYNNSSSFGAVDNKTEFKDYDYEDDAARQVLGGSWRMPTDAEWTELRNNCSWTWVKNYNGSGINGELVKATNGNSIFLPAAGYRFETYLSLAGSDCLYWSSSLYADNPINALYVGCLEFDIYRGNNFRYLGRPVRPVSE